MRYLILSDLHGNLEASRAVLRQAPAHDRLLYLGDLVGYGASPNEVVQLVRRIKPFGIIRGNHDKACTGLESGDNFNAHAYQSVLWTRDHLRDRNLEYLRRLPAGPLQVDDLVTVAHGSPMDEDFYILYENDAFMSFQYFTTPVCFFGHTHVPGVFVLEQTPPSFYYFIPRDRFELRVDLSGAVRYLVNPGSVGQPRDYDPRACFCLLDTDRQVLSFYKIAYPVAGAARRIERAGLPAFLGDRLHGGI